MKKYFEMCKNLQEAKALYKKLARENHPDLGGDCKTMQEINAQYEKAFDLLKKAEESRQAKESGEPKQTASAETAAEFIEIVNKLVVLEGLEVELCGRWIWIGGETMKNKEALKAAGCRWSSKKKLWYWHFPDEKPYNKKSVSMSEIREKYGSQSFQSKRTVMIGA